MTKRLSASSTAKTPGTVLSIPPLRFVIDTDEKLPYTLDPSIRKKLRTADYSLEGFENLAVIERKSKRDAYSTIGRGRCRFVRELERMAAIRARSGYAAVVIECSQREFVEDPPALSRLHPRAAVGSVLAWSVRYDVPVIWCDTREYAQATVAKLLTFIWEHWLINGVGAKFDGERFVRPVRTVRPEPLEGVSSRDS